MIFDDTPPDIPAGLLTIIKEHLRHTGITSNDNNLTRYLKTAIEIFENETKRAVLTRAFTQVFDRFPCESYFLLERAPFFDDGSDPLTISYYDRENDLVEFDTTNFSYTEQAIPPKVFLHESKNWPSDIHISRPGAVVVEYSAGYGTAESDLPAGLIEALAMLVGDQNNFREDSLYSPGGTLVRVSTDSKRLMDKYRTGFYEWRTQSR